MSGNCKGAEAPSGDVLHRDNVRFTFWRDNGEPKLADDLSVDVGFTHSIQVIREQKQAITQ